MFRGVCMIEYIILLLMAIFLLIFVFVLLKREQERQEQERKIQEACERIDSLGGTTYIKQQLKTKSAGKIAEKHNLTLESLNRYCQEQGTSINQLKKEIQKEERLRKKQEKQRQQQEQKRKIQEVYEALNRLGGAEHIKQQLKTKNAEEIAQEFNINTKNLNQYCQEQGTSINQLKKEIRKEERQHQKRLEKQRQEREYQRQLRQQHEQATRRIRQQQKQEREHREQERRQQEKERQRGKKERKIQEAYERIDRLGGTEHIKQRLKTTKLEIIAQGYNITIENLNQYCQEQGTSINQLKKENKEQATRRIKQQQKEQATRRIKQQQKPERQDRYMKNLKNEKRMRGY